MLILTTLFVRSSYLWVDGVAGAVFILVWYGVCVADTGMALSTSAPRSGNFILTFGVPTALPVGMCWTRADQYGESGLIAVQGPRALWLLVSGLALWATVLMLVAHFAGYSRAPLAAASGDSRPAASSNATQRRSETVPRTGLVVFGPLWLSLCAVNGAIGVLSVGYSVQEEIPVYLLNAVPPIALAAALCAVQRLRCEHTRATEPDGL
ncbi:hypothetical protein ACIOWI_34865 [Streptomyces sp. NPDC087659]|uniref:hypothetical protein n=1 Tax=Streptomyces sp. NPDC087659 TaxID=3365801 RepID=UPI00381FB4A2